MAIVVLVLWMFTAGAGFYLLVTSNLGRARPAGAPAAATHASAAAKHPPAATHAPAAATHAPADERATASVTTPAAQAALSPPATPPAPQTPSASLGAPVTSGTSASTASPASKREMRRAARDRFDPPSLTAAKNAPVVPGLRTLLEFTHPACAIVGLGFWLGYTLVHYRALGWIAFALVTVTACLGLSWFMANTRVARYPDAASHDEPLPSFNSRLIALHGAAAALTFVLAALTVLVLRR
jgi:hypothetical protein